MVLRGENGAPYVLWSLLTANGHRYDVRSFTLVLRYRVLEQPGSGPAGVGSGRPDPVRVPTV